MEDDVISPTAEKFEPEVITGSDLSVVTKTEEDIYAPSV